MSAVETPRPRFFWHVILAGMALRLVWALMMPVIILGGIFSGVFTATEAGTRVELTHGRWGVHGAHAAEMRADYDGGWDRVLGQCFGAAPGGHSPSRCVFRDKTVACW